MQNDTFSEADLEKVAIGTTFSSKYLNGKAKVLGIDTENNKLKVEVKNKLGNTHIDNDWNLQHTIWGFDRNEYYIINDYDA